jgi:hypothetical protein
VSAHRTMTFDSNVREMVRKAVAEGQWHLIYTMVTATFGGQSYEMKCKICGEFGNIMASTFVHARLSGGERRKRSHKRQQE